MAILCQLCSTSRMALDDKVDLSHLLSLSAISAGCVPLVFCNLSHWATFAKAYIHVSFTTILKWSQCRRFIDYAEGDTTAFEKIKIFLGGKQQLCSFLLLVLTPMMWRCYQKGHTYHSGEWCSYYMYPNGKHKWMTVVVWWWWYSDAQSD